MEALDHAAVGGLQGEVDAAGLRLAGAHEKLVGPEEFFADPDDGHADRPEHGLIESPRRFEIAYDKVDVIDQSAPIEVHLAAPP